MINGGSRSAVFLDRDGVLNASVATDKGAVRAPWTLDEVDVWLQHQPAVNDLAEMGWLVVVVSNQPDVSRGFLLEEDARTINAFITDQFPGIADSYLCTHTGADGCSCRKPLPGMLFAAAEEWHIDLSSSWMVGDRWVDIAAGAAAGCRTVLIEHTHSWEATSQGSPPLDLTPDYRVSDLTEAVALIMREKH